MALVQDIDSDITLSAAVDDLQVNPLEGWVRESIIARIPGSSHAGK
jgi:hypothetical protein